MRRLPRTCAALLWFAAATAAASSPPGGSFDRLSLEELLDLRTSVATKTERPLREVPGIVTVITRDEILASGARALVDVLLLVPGFPFAVDMQNAVAPGVRGVWGQEGKVLLLLDGQQINDPFYDGLALGNHFPVDQLERVEIIRGPGSAVHGRYAQLAVVSLVTREAGAGTLLHLQGTYGQMAGGLGRRTLSAQAGGALLDGELRLTASAYLGEGRRSDRTYRDFRGVEFPMSDGSSLNPRMLNLSLAYRDLTLRFIYDGYRVGMRDGLGEVLPPVAGSWEALLGEARYGWTLGAVRVEPRLRFRRQSPWRVTESSSPIFYDKTEEHYEAGVTASWKPTEDLDLLAGVETSWDHGRLNQPPDHLMRLFPGGRMAVDYQSAATHAQVLYDGEPVHLALGARWEWFSGSGAAFVPRVALTKVLGGAHLKLLYAQAFRPAGFENLVSGAIRPERTEVLEGELGYQLGEHLFAALNLFDIKLKDPIVYFADPATGAEGYRNFAQTGSRGMELDARLKLGPSFINATWSFYTAAGRNLVDSYSVPGSTALAQAFPAHKVTVRGSFHVGRHFVLGPAVVWTSDRHAYLRADASGNPEIGNAGGLFIVNLHALWRNLGAVGLDVGAGVYNLLDSRNEFLPAYPGHAPLPGGSREVVLRVTYELGREER